MKNANSYQTYASNLRKVKPSLVSAYLVFKWYAISADYYRLDVEEFEEALRSKERLKNIVSTKQLDIRKEQLKIYRHILELLSPFVEDYCKLTNIALEYDAQDFQQKMSKSQKRRLRHREKTPVIKRTEPLKPYVTSKQVDDILERLKTKHTATYYDTFQHLFGVIQSTNPQTVNEMRELRQFFYEQLRKKSEDGSACFLRDVDFITAINQGDLSKAKLKKLRRKLSLWGFFPVEKYTSDATSEYYYRRFKWAIPKKSGSVANVVHSQTI